MDRVELMKNIDFLVGQVASMKARLKIVHDSYGVERCFFCSTKNKLTKHHLQLKNGRTKNYWITLCRPCHDDVEEKRKGWNKFYRNYYKTWKKHSIKIMKDKTKGYIKSKDWTKVNGKINYHLRKLEKEFWSLI